MNDRDYSLLEGVRRSELWWLNTSPLHYLYHLNEPEIGSQALIFGQAAHKWILEPDTFDDEVAILPEINRRTKEGRALYEAFQAENDGKTIITADDFDIIRDMKEALYTDPDIRELLENAKATEQAYVWTDAETGIRCKVKADMITELDGQPIILDYKTTASCADGAFERSCRKYGYDFQSGMYTEGVNISTLEAHGFVFLAQEKEPPYAPRLYWCDEGFIEKGKRTFHRLLRQLKECQTTDTWKGYDSTELYEEMYD